MEIGNHKNLGKDIQVSGHNIVPYLANLTKYMVENGLEANPLPKVVLSSDTQYANEPFGRTAYYDPQNKVVTLFVAGRHIKDVLRSFAHEMIHHSQFLTGMFDESHLGALEDPRYAENDKHMMNMEKDAYLRGNMFFRTWEDSFK
jgi:hypothetical protein